jgi:hypothetical protein
MIYELFQYRQDVFDWLKKKPVYVRWGFYYSILFLIIFLGYFGQQPFIYFQF